MPITLRGKSILAIAKDVADGYFFVNPLVLKKLDPEGFKELQFHMTKLQKEIRNERFPMNDPLAIRHRNMRLQRLHNALVVLKHVAKERKIPI